MKVVLNPPEYSADILARHTARETMVRLKQKNLLAAYHSKLATLQCSTSADPNADVAIDSAKVNNDIIELEFEITQDVEIILSEKEKSKYRSDGKTYTDHVNKLATHREQVFGLIMRKCTQLLQDKMKQDAQW